LDHAKDAFMPRDSFKTVYSTEKPACRKCGRVDCICGQGAPAASGPIRVGRETKGRKGAGVTVVTGLALPEAELKALLSDSKKRLGCGGTLRGTVLEFQGEHRDTLLAFLKDRGISAKKSGS
jgi:translation initiation factor 1